MEDALSAVAAGADALGFVFYPKSPRYVSPAVVRQIVAVLPPFVTTVGLFVNATAEEINQVMTLAGLQVVQLHGDESPAECEKLERWPLIKAVRVKGTDSLKGLSAYSVQALLLDAWSDKQYGGSGHSFDWQLLTELEWKIPVILAGGLNPANVAEAIRQVAPYAVDVSSGVEKSPGCKDHQLMTQFIRQVKQNEL